MTKHSVSSSASNSSTRARGARTLGVLLLSLLCGLLLAEGVVRIADRLGLVSLQASLADLPVTTSSDEAAQMDTANGDRPLHIADTRLHHRMAPNWTGEFPAELMQALDRGNAPIRTNSLGLRSAEIMQPKPAGVVRIVALGDSVTFGWGLRAEDAYPSQLAGLLATLRPDQRYEVINAGVSGYGTWQELRWLQTDGLALQPDIIVVQVHLNDAADNLWGAIGGQSNGQSWPARHSLLARLVQRVLDNTPTDNTQPCAADWKVGVERVCWADTEALLDDLHAMATGAKARVVLLPAPMRWQVEAGVRDARAWVTATQYQEVLRRYAAENGWLFADPLPAFMQAAAGGQALFVDVGHPNEAGQRLLAQAVYSAISE